MTKCALFWKKVEEFKGKEDFEGFRKWCGYKSYDQARRDWNTVDTFAIIAKKLDVDMCEVCSSANLSENALMPIIEKRVYVGKDKTAPAPIQELAIELLLPKIKNGKKISEKDSRAVLKQIKGSLSDKRKKEHPYLGEFEPEITTLWRFRKCDERFGIPGFPGRLAGQVIMNLLYYYTKEGDVVVDPFAGSGTTIDVCKLMKRKCIALDLNPVRNDVKKHDVTKSIPSFLRDKCDFVFLDPPYWKMKTVDYSESLDDLANVSLDQFHGAMKDVAINCSKMLKKGKMLAFIIANFREGNFFVDLGLNCHNIFLGSQFIPQERIIVSAPTSDKSFTPLLLARAKTNKFILRGFRDLFIYKKK